MPLTPHEALIHLMVITSASDQPDFCSSRSHSLRGPITVWLRGTEIFDEEAIREWVREARIESANLPELTRVYLEMVRHESQLKALADQASSDSRANLQSTLNAHEQRLQGAKSPKLQSPRRGIASLPG